MAHGKVHTSALPYYFVLLNFLGVLIIARSANVH